MKTTPTLEKQIAGILNGLVPTKHRNFTTAIKQEKPAECVASYRRTLRVRAITIYAGHFENSLDMLGAGIHELAHHLAYSNGERKRIKHGQLFRYYLDALIRRFNYEYGKMIKGRLVWSRRKPTRSPRFVKF